MKRVAVVLAVVAVLVTGALAAFVIHRLQEGKDVRGSSTVEFVPREPRHPTRLPAKVPWPMYGLDPAHTRVAELALRPPFRKRWTYHAGSLVEFPPSIGYGRLYFATNSGNFAAVNAQTGKRAWIYRARRCVAASPAIGDKLVYQAFMNRPPCNASTGGHGLNGEIVAFAVGFGKIKWRRTIGVTESSPVLVGNLLYVGDWNGEVWALDARNGRTIWRFPTHGAVKGAVAVSGRRLYVGSYDGHVYALTARTGKLLWRAKGQPRLGHTGTFYSTPTVAYGRVYIGATDGKVYSFGATSGKLRWSHSTGDYVYSSPAAWRQRIFVGSYNGRFYCFDAATGDERWRFTANGPISGSPTVIGDVVYFATLKRRTYALDARTGKLLWSFPDGKYTPAVAAGNRLYLVGYGQVYGMVQR